jgi:ABC-type glutathione transport system ATPase component
MVFVSHNVLVLKRVFESVALSDSSKSVRAGRRSFVIEQLRIAYDALPQDARAQIGRLLEPEMR